MRTMHETQEQPGERRSDAATQRSDVWPAAERPDVPQWTADTLSGGLRAAWEHHQAVAVLRVHGEVDLGTAPRLWEVLLPALECESGPVVVDLSEVSFMDSTGVHVLVDILRRLEPQNRRLAVVCREGGQVPRLLALVGLVDALNVHRSLESALIGGDDFLRSEPGKNGRPSDARAPTSLL